MSDENEDLVTAMQKMLLELVQSMSEADLTTSIENADTQIHDAVEIAKLADNDEDVLAQMYMCATLIGARNRFVAELNRRHGFGSA